MTKPFMKSAISQARWIVTFEEGALWETGAFSAKVEGELVRMGVLVPTGKPGMFTVAHVDIDSLPVCQ